MSPAARTTIGVIVVIALVIGSAALISACQTVQQDQVGFQIGGGPLDPDRKKVKSELISPGRHITGTLDKMWVFPSNRALRFEDFEVPVTTKDGKRVTLSGQTNFRFVGEKDPTLAKVFATGIGARKYDGNRPGENNEGWSAMLQRLMLPEIIASLKEQVGAVNCADFEPACRAIDPRKDVPDTDSEAVYEQVASLLDKRLVQKLGEPFFQDLFIRVTRIELQGEVQKAIDRVTAEQAKTKAAEQSEKTAQAEANAIRIKGKAIRANPKLIGVEIVKNCPDSCNVIVDGSGKGASVAVPSK